jgi:hypothetical protein
MNITPPTFCTVLLIKKYLRLKRKEHKLIDEEC